MNNCRLDKLHSKNPAAHTGYRGVGMKSYTVTYDVTCTVLQ